MNVIKVENISKLYRLGQVGTGSIFHDVNRWWHGVRGKEDPYMRVGEENDRTKKGEGDYVWALKDINFEVAQGEVLGIIGRNGAGKSTLLKILSRTTAPTTGTIKVKGRIASLLEVGTGFHPELSGRDNIFMNGTILGMTRAEIKSKFDEIVQFAGIERYLDTPVKRYSSGMYVRLAFAVAAHLESEILIVDEVLAVGDIEFQKKCLGKIKDVSEKQGRSVLFVSHNISSIKYLSNKCILIDQGNILHHDEGSIVVNKYEQLNTKIYSSIWKNHNEQDSLISISSVRVLNSDFNSKRNFISSEKIIIEIKLLVKENFEHVKLGFDLLKYHETVFRSHQIDSLNVSNFLAGCYVFNCEIPENLLNEGEYQLKVNLSIHCVKDLINNIQPAIKFEVKLDTSKSPFHLVLNEKNHPGYIYPLLNWSLK
jgi:lipopolysaccharide transport system ATP-binding protein